MPAPTIIPKTPLTSDLSRSADELDWRRAAACVNLPQHSVFTRVPSEAEPVLRACNQCPIRRECEVVVDPAHTFFDGVSGGRLWRNGREVKRTRADASRQAGR